jgi:hypothetical protein
MKRIKAEEERKDRERKRKLFWRNLIIAITSVSLVISLGFGLWGYINYCDATKKSYEAEVEKQKATNNLIKFKNSQYEKYKANGDNAKAGALYTLAIENYEAAKDWIFIESDTTMPIADTNCPLSFIFDKIITKNSRKQRGLNNTTNAQASELPHGYNAKLDDSIQKAKMIENQIDICESLNAKNQSIQNLVRQGNEAHGKKLYFEAMTFYKQAYREDPNLGLGEDAFKETQKEAIRMYTKSIEDLKNINTEDAKRKKKSLFEKLKQVDTLDLYK